MAAAATLVRRPLDPLLRARVHALAIESLVLLRRIGPAGQAAAARVAAQVDATRDVFSDDQPIEVEDSADAETEFTGATVVSTLIFEVRSIFAATAFASKARSTPRPRRSRSGW